jgi:hypothetical protein
MSISLEKNLPRLAALLLLMGCLTVAVCAQAAPVIRTDMSVTEARVALRNAITSMMVSGSIFACCGREKMSIHDTDPPANLKVTSRQYSFTERGHYGVWTSSCLLCGSVWNQAGAYEFPTYAKFGYQYVAVRECKGQFGIVWFGTKQWMQAGILTWSTQAGAQAFVDAFNFLNSAYLHRDAAKDDAELNDFSAAAKAWRESATKPPLPDAAYREKVLAEESIREKDMESAIVHYEKGLKAEPLWPQGHFNVALLDAEIEDYYYAIWHMKRYLALLPDAPDAQAARDKLIIWENKAQNEK